MLVKTSETGCPLVALFFLDFPNLRTDSFLDNSTTAHLCIEIFICKSSCGNSPVVCFTLATSTGAMDVLLSAGQRQVCLSHSSGTQGKLHLVWNFSC